MVYTAKMIEDALKAFFGDSIKEHSEEIRTLDADLIYIANYKSESGEVGSVYERSYRLYAEAIVGWGVGEVQRKKLLEELHARFTAELYEYITERAEQ